MTIESDQIPVEPERRPFWTRHLYRQGQFVLDFVVLVGAFVLAYLLRFEFQIPPNELHDALVQLPLVVLLQFGVAFLVGIYSFVWRYIGMAEVMPFVRAAVYSSAPLLILRLGLPAQFASWRVPISIILMDAVFAFGGLLGLRVLRRAIYERYERTRREKANGNSRRRLVLLVGAGRAGVMAVRELHGRGDTDLEIVGFVDDDRLKLGTVIQGVKVLGTCSDLSELISRHDIDHVVITMAEVDRQKIRSIVDICERCGVRARIIPGLFEILEGSLAVNRFRDVQIQDLLGREQVRLDEEELRRFLTGKAVMVTGAGGSIGSELCRQIARYNPLHLFLVERAEGALFEIEQELGELWPGLSIEALVADVGDGIRMRKILETRHPHVILHAAAHKHVPMMEKHPGEAVRNNILATASLGQMAGQAGVQAFVLISTDKAVCPTSVMGATKRVAELVVQDLDQRFKKSRFLAVRFGNVMGSAGSVIPIFRRQIERGGPVTVTHPEVMRYFMTPSEAAQLVLEAGALGKGGEIMVLDMGRPVKILELAKDMITLSGYKPFEEIPITFTGLRPGEKLFEELELSGEKIDRTRHPKIFVGRLNAFPAKDIEAAMAHLGNLVQGARYDEIRMYLDELLPEAQLNRRGEPRYEAAEASATELLH